jgi:LEA14-like dessication related protein
MRVLSRPVAGVLASVALLCACSKPAPPTLTPRAARVTSVEPSGLVLTLELDVQNPNSFPLIAQAVDGTLELANGTELGRAHAEPNGSIPANSASSVSSELRVPWTNLGALAPLLASPADVPYRFRGTATLGGERLNLRLPFELGGVLSRAQVLEIGLRGLGPVHLN